MIRRVQLCVRVWRAWQLAVQLDGSAGEGWVDQDEAALAAFLATPTGRKMVRVLRRTALEQATRATEYTDTSAERANGIALGYRALLTVFMSLSDRPPEVAEEYPDPLDLSRQRDDVGELIEP